LNPGFAILSPKKGIAGLGDADFDIELEGEAELEGDLEADIDEDGELDEEGERLDEGDIVLT
jgi:hypothetical protein